MEQRYDPAVPVDELVEHPDNPRRGDEAAIEASMAAHGFFGAVLVQASTRRIIAGNHRTRVARRRGEVTVPVLFLDVDDDQARRLLLVDNRANDLAGYDDRELVALLDELAAADDGLTGTGFDDADLAKLIDELGKATPVGLDELPPASPEHTAPGDLWLLGEHRLLCGDAAGDPGQLAYLTGHLAPTVAYMDPPYGMALATNYKKMHHQGRSKWGSSNNFPAVAGDDVDFDAAPLIERLAGCREQFWWGADYYRATVPLGGSWLVWDKRSLHDEPVLDNVHGNQFELCWSARPHRRVLLRHVWSGLHGVHGEGEVHRRVHPTQKPVALHVDILGEHAKRGDVVVDLYAGSGSTLIACHQLGLTALAAELIPAYVDTICARWQHATGVLPVREATGEIVDFADARPA